MCILLRKVLLTKVLFVENMYLFTCFIFIYIFVKKHKFGTTNLC